jgi:hypothetical protein
MLKQIYVRKEDIPLWDEFSKICRREGKGLTEVIKELVAEYVKNHKEGNSTFVLEKWLKDPEFMALPSLGEILTPKYLDGLDEKNLDVLDQKVCCRYNEVQAALRRRY